MDQQLTSVKEAFRKELIENVLPFWMIKTIDNLKGGFWGRLDFTGTHDPLEPKGAILNARILWTFSALYNQMRNKEFIEVADRAYEYISTHFLDKEYGGVHWKLDSSGQPVESKKQIYAIAFMIYAFSEYFRVTGNKNVLEESIDLYKVIEKYSFDTVHGGYLEAFSREWDSLEDLRLSNIDENEKKTLNTHLHLLEAYTGLFQVWPDEDLKNKLSALATLFSDRFISDNQEYFKLFFDEQWNLRSDRISPGHDIETAWLLLETARTLEDKSLTSKAERISLNIADSVIRTGMDETGGLVYERNHEKITNYNKEWWCHVEALVGFHNAWEISGDKRFAEMVQKMWDFITNYFIDRVNGEWHFRIDRQGRPYNDLDKAGFWKCPYHTVRACLELIRRIG